MEDSLVVSCKIKHTLTPWLRNSTPSYLPKVSENICPFRHVHSSLMNNGPKLETTQMSIGWMNKQMLVCSFDGILLMTKKSKICWDTRQCGWISANTMLSKRSQTQKETYCTIPHRWNSKKSKLLYRDKKRISGHRKPRASLRGADWERHKGTFQGDDGGA